MTKTCTKCGTEYPATTEFFYYHSKAKGILRPDCKLCCKQKALLYYNNHKDGRATYARVYRSYFNNHLQQVYRGICKRCNNPKNKDYKYYGGRGIKCLFKSADEFVDYVINKLQVDRIDNNGHYEEGNIRFVTSKENNNNRRPRKRKGDRR